MLFCQGLGYPLCLTYAYLRMEPLPKPISAHETVYSKMESNLENIKQTAVECVSRPTLEYSRMTDEQLLHKYEIRKKLGNPTMGLAIELHKRGLRIEEPFTPNLSFAKPLKREPQ